MSIFRLFSALSSSLVITLYHFINFFVIIFVFCKIFFVLCARSNKILKFLHCVLWLLSIFFEGSVLILYIWFLLFYFWRWNFFLILPVPSNSVKFFENLFCLCPLFVCSPNHVQSLKFFSFSDWLFFFFAYFISFQFLKFNWILLKKCKIFLLLSCILHFVRLESNIHKYFIFLFGKISGFSEQNSDTFVFRNRNF